MPFFILNVPCATFTTSTTTTLPPLTITNGAVTCTGTTGNFTSTFSGGTGTYHTAAIDNSPANVANLVAGGAGSGTGTRIILSPGATSYNWTSIANGTWYTAVRDSALVSAVQNTGVSINCTTTTTTTSTTTTTTTSGTRTVRLYGARAGTIGSSYLYYNVNGGTLLGGYTLSTTGTLFTTFNVSNGDTVRVFTSPDASIPSTYHHDCAQVATNTYCTATSCTGATGKAFTITADTDLSVRSVPTLGTC